VKRREFIGLLGGAAAWPLEARAQQRTMPVIGFLNSGTAAGYAPFAAAFRQGLNEVGYIEGQNVAIEYRWAEGRYDRLPALAADLVRHQVNLIAATGGIGAALAAKAATTTVPIVFTSSDDPVKLGLVASFNRPGGNATGINFFISQMEGKRLGLLHEIVPTAALIGVLLNPSNAPFESQLKDVQEAARALGRQIHIVQASKTQDIHVAFKAFVQMGVQGLLVCGDPLVGANNSSRLQITTPFQRFMNCASTSRPAGL
jgi:putative ABC transport system substrate-binding protein